LAVILIDQADAKRTRMKKIVLLICLIAFNFTCKSQSLGGYPIIDHLVDAVHPNGCDITAVTGSPNDSTWVNLTVGDTMTGTFGNTWLNSVGSELLLETSFHADNYNVRLMLSPGSYSATHTVNTADWTLIADTAWVYVETNCNITVFFPHRRYVLPLDFETDFGLVATDIVSGIEIIFLTTPSGPDLAGAYIIGGTPIACDTIDLGNDTTVCNGQGLVLDVTYPEATFLWQDGSSAPSFHVTESGQYWVSVTTDCGVVTDTINVTIADVYPSIIDAGGNVLECTDPFYTYQWYFNGVLIVGATNQTYTVSAIGTYYVEVSDTNACEGISNAIVVDVLTGFNELSPHNMTVYPNPNLGRITLSTTLVPERVLVFNSVGQMVLNRITIDKNDLTFNLSVAGVYFIHAQFDDEFTVRKVIVW
jgi:hypothetical protein